MADKQYLNIVTVKSDTPKDKIPVANGNGGYDWKNLQLPVASKSELGTVKVGNGIDLAEDGTISVSADSGKVDVSTLEANYYDKNYIDTNIALKSEIYTQGEINEYLNSKVDKIVGKSLSTNDFTDEAATAVSTIADKVSKPSTSDEIGSVPTKTIDGYKWQKVINYELPVASSTQLGGVKVGAGLTMVDDVLKVLPDPSKADKDDLLLYYNKAEIDAKAFVDQSTLNSTLDKYITKDCTYSKTYLDSAFNNKLNIPAVEDEVGSVPTKTADGYIWKKPIEYKLPQASATEFGGVKAVPALPTQTQDVGIDSTGKLKVGPSAAVKKVTALPEVPEPIIYAMEENGELNFYLPCNI